MKSISADNSVLSHELFNVQVHYRVHKTLPLVPGVNQKNPVHTRFCFSKLRYNIILTSASRTIKRSVSFRLEKRDISRCSYQASLNNISTAGNCCKMVYFRPKEKMFLVYMHM